MTTAATHIAEPYGEGKVLIRDVELFAGYDPEIDDSREDADEMRKWDDEKVREVVDRTKFYMARGAYPKLVKLHQREGQDTPDESFGDIVEIRYEGRSGVPMIVGDIVVSEQTFKRDIASGAFPRRSAEIWPDGYLSEVALLGRETPARPLPDMRFSRNATTGAAPMVFVRNVEPATFAFDESKIKRAKDGKFATKEERSSDAEEKPAKVIRGDGREVDVVVPDREADEEAKRIEDAMDSEAVIEAANGVTDGLLGLDEAADKIADKFGISFDVAREIVAERVGAEPAGRVDDDDEDGGWDGAGTGFEYGPEGKPEGQSVDDEYAALDNTTRFNAVNAAMEVAETIATEPEFGELDGADYLSTTFDISMPLAEQLVSQALAENPDYAPSVDDEKDSAIEPDFDGMEDEARDLASQVRDGSLNFEDAIEGLSIDFMISEGDAADLLQTAIDSWESVESGSNDLADAGRLAINAMPTPGDLTPEELQEQGRQIIDGEMTDDRAFAEEILKLPHLQDAIESAARQIAFDPFDAWGDVEYLVDAIIADQGGGGRSVNPNDLREAIADRVGASDLPEYLEAEEEYIRKADRMRGDGYSSLNDPKRSKRRSERFKEMDRVATELAAALATGDMDWPAVLKGMKDSFPNASLDLVLGALNDARRRTQDRFSRRGRKQTFAATYPGAGNTTTPAYGDEDMNPVDDDREIMSRLEELEETYGRSRFAKACRGRYERDEDEEAETFGLAEGDEEKLGYQRSRKGRVAAKSARSTAARRREFARRLAAMKAAPQRDAALKRMNARLAALESRNNALRAELDRAEFSRAIDQMEAEGFRFNGQRESILDDIVGSRDPEGRMEFYRSVLPQAPIGQRIPTTGVRINQTAGAMSEDKIQFAREKAKAKAIASRGTDNPITYSEAFDEIVASMSKEA